VFLSFSRVCFSLLQHSHSGNFEKKFEFRKKNFNLKKLIQIFRAIFLSKKPKSKKILVYSNLCHHMMEAEQSEAIQKAAKLILDADFMIVATGAGMSADSGLPVYIDTQRVEAYIKRRLSYMDLCDPRWNFEDPETFYGFWGSSMNKYREAEPHSGYAILKKWQTQHFNDPEGNFSNKILCMKVLKIHQISLAQFSCTRQTLMHFI
jgi:hypothetical protein